MNEWIIKKEIYVNSSREEHIPKNKTSDEQIKIFKDFVESRPEILSHYCRSFSTKTYLPAEVRP